MDQVSTLESVLLTHPQNSEKIQTSALGLTRIGQIPSPFHNLKSLDLSENNLESLTGLSVLLNLCALNLSHNQLSSYTAISPVFALKILSKLDLSNNPVSSTAACRLYLVRSLPLLDWYNSRRLTLEDKLQANEFMEEFEPLTQAIVANEQLTSKLSHLRGTLQVHKELFKKQLLSECTDFNIHKWIEYSQWPGTDTIELEINQWMFQMIGQALDEAKVVDWAHCLAVQKEEIVIKKAECIALHTKRRELWESQPMDERVYYTMKQSDTCAIQQAIKDGIKAIVLKFRWEKQVPVLFKAWKSIVGASQPTQTQTRTYLSQLVATFQAKSVQKNYLKCAHAWFSYTLYSKIAERIALVKFHKAKEWRLKSKIFRAIRQAGELDVSLTWKEAQIQSRLQQLEESLAHAMHFDREPVPVKALLSEIDSYRAKEWAALKERNGRNTSVHERLNRLEMKIFRH